MSSGLPIGNETQVGAVERLAADYFVVCTRFATVPLFLPVVHGKELTLIDAGISDTPLRAIAPSIVGEGHRLSSVSTLLLTHGHHDHFGGIDALRSMAPGVTVAMHRDDINWVEDHERYWRELFQRFDGRAPSAEEARASVREQAGLPAVVDAIVEPGDLMSTLGASDLLAVDVHGSHSAGSLAYYNEHSSILATGDVLQASGTPFVDGTGAFPIYENIAAYLQTIGEFRELAPHTIVDAHRGILRGVAVNELLDACASFPDRLSAQLDELLAELQRPLGLAEIAHHLHDRFYPDMNKTIQLYQTVDLHMQDLLRHGSVATEIDGDSKRWATRR